MTSEEFQAWIEAMQISNANAAMLLGVHPNTITRYRKQGGPKMLSIACESLLAARRVNLAKEARTERKRARQRQRAKEERLWLEGRRDEGRPFRLCVRTNEAGMDPCLLLGKSKMDGGKYSRIRVVYPNGELSDEHWQSTEAIRDMTPEEYDSAIRYFSGAKWLKRLPDSPS